MILNGRTFSASANSDPSFSQDFLLLNLLSDGGDIM
jgi:hypothetical protein